MPYRFNCPLCGAGSETKFLSPGDEYLCRECNRRTHVPPSATKVGVETGDPERRQGHGPTLSDLHESSVENEARFAADSTILLARSLSFVAVALIFLGAAMAPRPSGHGAVATLIGFLPYFLGASLISAIARRLHTYAAKKEQIMRDIQAVEVRAEVAEGAPVRHRRPFFIYLRPGSSGHQFPASGELPAENLRRSANILSSAHWIENEVEDIEWQIVRALESVIPGVSLDPKAEHLGFGRLKNEGDSWQATFEELAPQAAFFLVLPSSAPGVLWEIEWLRSHQQLPRTVFLMVPETPGRSAVAPETRGNSEVAEEYWLHIAALLEKSGLHLPRYNKLGALFRLEPSGWIHLRYTHGLNPKRIRQKIQALIDSDFSYRDGDL